MQNPFETGHIKNYIFFYVSVVVIMVLFFIATTLFHDEKSVDQKRFDGEPQGQKKVDKREQGQSASETKKRFRLLEKAY